MTCVVLRSTLSYCTDYEFYFYCMLFLFCSACVRWVIYSIYFVTSLACLVPKRFLLTVISIIILLEL